jgi:hypothetical protein
MYFLALIFLGVWALRGSDFGHRGLRITSFWTFFPGITFSVLVSFGIGFCHPSLRVGFLRKLFSGHRDVVHVFGHLFIGHRLFCILFLGLGFWP